MIRTIKRCRERWQRINQTANRQRLELHEYYAEQLEPVEMRLTPSPHYLYIDMAKATTDTTCDPSRIRID